MRLLGPLFRHRYRERVMGRGMLFALLLASGFLLTCAAPTVQDGEVVRHLEAGDLDAALDDYPAAVRARSRELAAEPLELARYLDDLATSFFYAGGAEAAAELYERELEVLSEALGDDHPDVAVCLTNLAAVHAFLGRWSDAESLERRALEILEGQEGERDPFLDEVLQSLGDTLFKQGRYREALATWEQAEPRDDWLRSEILSARGEVHRLQGRFELAETLFQEALTAARQADDPLAEASVLNNLALLRQDRGLYDQTQSLLDRAVKIWEEAEETDAYALAGAYQNRAELFRFQGRYDEALPWYERALAMARRTLGDNHPELVYFLNGFALFHKDQERHDEAEPLYREALEILDQAPIENSLLQSHTLRDYAGLLAARGRFAEAHGLYEKTLKRTEDAFGARHPWAALVLTEWAEAAFRDPATDDRRALELVERALRIFERTEIEPEAQVRAHGLRAELLWRRGLASEAATAMARALDEVEALRPHTGTAAAARADFLARYLELFNRMVAWQVESGEPVKALEYAERARARVLLDQLAAGQVDLRSGIPPSTLEPLARREAGLRAEIAELQQQASTLRGRTDLPLKPRHRRIAELEERIDALTLEQQAVASKIRNASPLWNDVLTAGGEPVAFSVVQRTLVPPAGAIFFYQVGERESFLFVVPPAPGTITVERLTVPPAVARVLDVDAGTLDRGKLERIFRGSEETPGGLLSLRERPGGARGLRKVDEEAPAEDRRRQLDQRLHALKEILLPPGLWRRIAPLPEIVVVPDGALHHLPFEALVAAAAEGDGGPTYWLDGGPVVRYADSATSLERLVERGREALESEPLSALIVAVDPGEAADFHGLSPLPGTGAEADAIVDAYRGVAAADRVRRLDASTAEEIRVRQALSSPSRYLHFATHGLVDPRRSEGLAALALTPPVDGVARPENDGLLQLFEIYELDLASELSVLSACESHFGRRVAGEGVFALSRGFLAAGAHRVVASLWPVNDASTAKLMGELYRRLLRAAAAGEEIDYAAALRDARLAVRRDPRWSAPYYWAPFILTGIR